MSDLIDRQAAINALSVGKEALSRILDETDVVGTDREKYSWGLGLIESSIKDIEALPSAQPEIIRCKDCEHLKRSETSRRLMMCQRRGRLLNLVGEFDFCSKAERRNDD